MSIQRSPITKSSDKMNIISGNSSSQPEMSIIAATEHEYKNVSQSKRKVPEDDFSVQFNEFKKEIIGVLKEFGSSEHRTCPLPSGRPKPIANSYADIMTEVQERLERAKNIIIAGIFEPHSENMEEKREKERFEVMKVLSGIYALTPQPERIMRLGKYDGKKTRPLKVCFLTPDIAKTLLKINLTTK
ncbi:unnamed protein product [Parnassius apollo]|uniref:(apollo) hypothetical protein n=1 Tax=Parnassius apollo TaxID=110799 RepID=A0A8S3XS37_PARAO|nr:unnamed protein product [Parnassius apollo]